MRKKVLLVTSVVIILAVTVFLYPAIERRRDLNETLTWIDQTYNPHEGGANLGQGHGWERHYTPNPDNTEKLAQEFQTTFMSNGGCRVAIRDETHPVGVWEETPSVSTYLFDLADIDPSSITIKTFDPHKDIFSCQDPDDVKNFKLHCTNAEVAFLTRNGATAIREDYVRTFTKLTGADHEQSGTSKQQKTWLLVDDVDYAQRLAKAWKHAIELCGGRPSKF